MNRTAVRFDRLDKRFGAVAALDQFCGEVPEGSICALLGRNGAGKTTALKCLVGLLRPDGGKVIVQGRNGAELDLETRQTIGYVSERQNLDRRLSVGELVEYTSAFYPGWDESLADDLMERLALDPGSSLGQLSMGEGRKVSLLLNLAFRPALLVLDEPAANLDAVVRREFLETVLELFRGEGMTVLLSTHLLPDVERIADRVLLIECGRTRVESNLDDLKDQVKALRLIPTNGHPVRDPGLPGTLRVRRAGDELQVTVEGFDENKLRAACETSGARVEVMDLPLEEIFIAYGSRDEF